MRERQDSRDDNPAIPRYVRQPLRAVPLAGASLRGGGLVFQQHQGAKLHRAQFSLSIGARLMQTGAGGVSPLLKHDHECHNRTEVSSVVGHWSKACHLVHGLSGCSRPR